MPSPAFIGKGAAQNRDPRDHLRMALAARSAAELDTIARTKRFRERLIGDAAFRDALRGGMIVDTSPYEPYRPLWDLACGRHAFASSHGLDSWPDIALWKAWHDDLLAYRDLMTAYPARHGTNARFGAWRHRQMARVCSELGAPHETITHPAIAYELADGCSVGCWFCGISADAFRRSAGHAQDGVLWRGMLEAVVARLGPAARTGFCYWGTDPMDTPDYDLFLADHAAATGWAPQTTTAAPLRNPDLIRRVLALSTPEEPVLNRFSVLTLRQLEAIFQVFTPREMLLVEVVPQMKGSLMPKARAGRALQRERTMLAREADPVALGLSATATTIACVSGFLVNLPDRRVRLVAPCRADGEHPSGYITFADARFEHGAGFAACLDAMIDEHMPEALTGDAVIAFRRDLAVSVSENALVLSNAATRHRVGSYRFLPAVAEFLEKPRTVASLSGALLDRGADVFEVHALIGDLYDGALIEILHRGPAPAFSSVTAMN